MSAKPAPVQIFDENHVVKKSASKSSSKKRKPLASIENNGPSQSNNAKTPSKEKTTQKEYTTPQPTKSSKSSPIRALNESLFEIVAESPRDVKIRELTRMVKAFKDDARCIRDIYAEEIESLRQELESARKLNEQPSAIATVATPATEAENAITGVEEAKIPPCKLASTPQRPKILNDTLERSSNVGIKHAHTIISEAESIIAMAEAMLNVSGNTTAIPVSSVKRREEELLYLKERVLELESLHSKDQQKMNEMEIVMKGMALKLEEYSRGSLAEDWMKRVMQLFST